MKRIILVLTLLGCVVSASAKKWVDARDLAIHGYTQKSEKYPYYRFDFSKYNLTKTVKMLAEAPAGLYVAFKTNSSNIYAAWDIAPHRLRDNMPMIMQRGLDLYIKHDGEWRYVQATRPSVDASLTSYEKRIAKYLPEGENEYILYLPGWCEIKSLKIGIDDNATISGMPSPFRHKVIVYGSSITHGAAASRAGMTYPARMSRNLGIEFTNFGFSGYCMMQPEFLDFLKSCETDAFLFDTFSNPSAEVIAERLPNFVEELVKAHPGKPLIFMQSAIPVNDCIDAGRRAKRIKRIDTARDLMQEIVKKYKDVYFLEILDVTGKDGSVDNTHPSDLGFDRFIKGYQPKIAKILRKYGIK